MQLKQYQERSLEALAAYFAECRRTGDADTAFYSVTRQVFGSGIPYRQVRDLPGLPYVCLRIPTGGGKTLVAAHAAGLAAHDLVETDRPVVLWLVPSNPIREQTFAALRERTHPYRRALEERLGPVEVMDVSEALSASRARYAGGAMVVIATMQSFRREDTEGVRVYRQNGSLMDHFSGLPPEAVAELERQEDGTPLPSLANVLRLYRPILIVDEAHNARTDLSFETLARFRPSCVIEFSATPAREGNPSNVLHSVSAAELDVEDMIKLPILLETRPDWRLLLGDAISRLNSLDEAASQERVATGEYIRPIMLLQAEAKRGSDPVTVDVVRRTLIEDHRVPEEQIALATGGASDLDGIDVLSPSCPVRFVITVQQLREGWDCPFAYVLCSVAQMRSTTAVEQLLGRVMRLPRARKKVQAELNRAYAFSASSSFADAATALAEALVQNGFEKQEARQLIAAATPRTDTAELPLWDGWEAEPAPIVTITVSDPPNLSALPEQLARKLTIDSAAGTLTLRGELSEAERDTLADAIGGESGRDAAAALYQRAEQEKRMVKQATAARPVLPFSVPLLAIRQGDLWEPFEATHFLEAAWDLACCDPRLTDAEWSPGATDARVGQVTITDEGRAKYFLTDLHQQLSLVADDRNWSPGALVHWLDRTIAHPDVDPEASGIFLTGLVRHLLDERGIPLGTLVRDKYALRHAVAAKIQAHRAAAYGSEYQALLLPDSPTPVGVTPEVCFTYEPGKYPYQFVYRGARQWQRHFYPNVGDLKNEGEEFECAAFLDEALPEVKRWVRNVERPPSFSLQTQTDRFYPDFVCELHDGRFLVVEYKGEHLWSNDDSREKRTLGGLWEERSEGRCLFVMPKGRDFGAIRARVSG